jgi:hypothetical protein
MKTKQKKITTVQTSDKPNVEVYTPERKAEFLLSNAINSEDYETAKEEVRKMGLDPAKIEHYKFNP